ncbi:DUF3993 domain-containing protein [Cytobacillus suaedae]|nr:DUF3993 domain-containing protein [Cytobacillus suaedae]
MSKRHYFIMSIIVLGFLFHHQTVKAQEPLTREDAFDFLKEAYKAQTSLGEKYQTYKEARETLNPYFTDDYAKLFLEENLVYEEGGYTIYGSDFALYYIPFYSYTDDTKFIYDSEKNQIYVYEFFLKPEEGPVDYEDHYETVILIEDEGNWKVNEFVESAKKPEFIESIENESVSNKTVPNKEEFKIVPTQDHSYISYQLWGSYFVLQMEYQNQFTQVMKKEPLRFLFLIYFFSR